MFFSKVLLSLILLVGAFAIDKTWTEYVRPEVGDHIAVQQLQSNGASKTMRSSQNVRYVPSLVCYSSWVGITVLLFSSEAARAAKNIRKERVT